MEGRMKEEPLLTSLQNPWVKHCVRLRKESAYRENHHSFLVEGAQFFREIDLPLIRCFYTTEWKDTVSSLLCEKYPVSGPVMEKISGVKSLEGIVGEVKMPLCRKVEPLDRVVIFDAVSDPGNLGTLMRTALAFGWNYLFFLPGCCDPFNEKTIRAAKGAHFKIEMCKGSVEELRLFCKKHQLSPLAAQIGGLSIEALPPSEHRWIVLGNEAHGVSPDVEAFSLPIQIPMTGEMESLNVAVAGGILLYFLSKKEIK